MATKLSERQRGLREEFLDARGYWNENWEELLRLDEDFFAAYLSFSSVPWKTGPLEPKVKEFVYIAVDAAATHLFTPGIRSHIKRALELGATTAGDHGGDRTHLDPRHPRRQHRRPDPGRGGRRRPDNG